MTAQWYYAIQGRTLGPVSGEALRARARRGELQATDLVWREGMPEWVSAESLGLSAGIEPPPLADDVRPPPPVAAGDQRRLDSTPPPAPPVATTFADAPPSAATTPPLDQPPPVRPSPRPAAADHGSRRTWVFRALWLTVGIVAILCCGIWIGSGAGTRSQDQLARVAGTAPGLGDAAGPGSASPTPNQPAAPQPAAPQPAAPQPATRPPDAARPTEPRPVAPIQSPRHPPAEAPAMPEAAPPQPDSPPALPKATGVGHRDDGPRLFFQTLEIDRQPTFVVLGKTVAQALRYRIVSQLELAARAADGTRKVVQIVERTHLDHADDLSRATFASSLKALERQQYTFTLNPQHEVTEFVGPRKRPESIAVNLLAAKGVQLSSVIDDDGWKELAELTFFQPDEGVAQGAPYVRQITHDWSPLGTWSGTTTFAGQNIAGEKQTITFKHALTYSPPKATAAAGPMGLRIVSAECTIDQADGTIQYDRSRGRIESARESFAVQGTVATELVGQPATIQLQERQTMTIRITDQRPTGN